LTELIGNDILIQIVEQILLVLRIPSFGGHMLASSRRALFASLIISSLLVSSAGWAAITCPYNANGLIYASNVSCLGGATCYGELNSEQWAIASSNAETCGGGEYYAARYVYDASGGYWYNEDQDGQTGFIFGCWPASIIDADIPGCTESLSATPTPSAYPYTLSNSVFDTRA